MQTNALQFRKVLFTCPDLLITDNARLRAQVDRIVVHYLHSQCPKLTRNYTSRTIVLEYHAYCGGMRHGRHYLASSPRRRTSVRIIVWMSFQPKKHPHRNTLCRHPREGGDPLNACIVVSNMDRDAGPPRLRGDDGISV